MKPIIIGSIAAFFFPKLTVINAVSGLEVLFTGNKNSLARRVVQFLFRIIVKRKKTGFIYFLIYNIMENLIITNVQLNSQNINMWIAIDGIKNITVDTNSNSININSTNEKALEEAKTLLYKLGYPVQGGNNSFGTKAKSFVSCAIGKIEKS